jgi:phosphoglycerate dehydrogenase-like enzyme
MLVMISENVHRDHGARLQALAPAAAWLRLQDDGTLRLGDDVVDPAAVEPDVAFISNDVFYGPVKACFELLESWSSLEWVQSAAAGTEAPLYRTLVSRNCRITRAHVTAVPIAEYVLRAVLTHFQQPHRLVEQQAAHVWQHQPFREVSRSRWLVVGLGSIGGEVATRARAFGAHVVGVRRTVQGNEPVDELCIPAEMLAQAPLADVVVLAAAGGDETRNMIGREFLERMKPGSAFVNVARGYMVDEAALLEALDRGVPEIAILDVFATEPLPADNVFWDHPRVVVSPHSSGGGDGRVQRAVDVFAENLQLWQRGGQLLHEITEADLPAQPETWVSEKR